MQKKRSGEFAGENVQLAFIGSWSSPDSYLRGSNFIRFLSPGFFPWTFPDFFFRTVPRGLDGKIHSFTEKNKVWGKRPDGMLLVLFNGRPIFFRLLHAFHCPPLLS